MRQQAEERATGFWAQAEPGRDVAWRVVAAALDLRCEAARVRRELDGLSSKAMPAELVQRYAESSPVYADGAGTGGWYRLDARHREVEYLATGLGEAFADAGMERLLHRARHVYRAAAEALNARFIAAFEKVGFEFASLHPQADTFDRYVRPSLDAGPVAYVLVDALRYEMGMELFASLSQSGRIHDPHARPAIGVVPTITPIGMAALLPGAEEGVGLVPAAGDVAAVVKDHVLKNYADRKALWSDRFDSRLADLTLGEVLTMRTDKLKKQVAGKALILVRSQEIDEFGEQGNPYQARRTMSEVIGDVKKAVNLLANVGVSQFVVAADHGHLLFEELDEDQKIDPPGGDTVSLHRRCWVGRGGAVAPGVLRLKAADVGMGGDLELAFPRGLGAFKAGGATTYFHGGLSPQELIVPILAFTLESARPAAEGKTGFSLGFPQGKITTRVFTVTARFDQYQPSLMDDPTVPVTRRVRCDAWDGKKSVARALAALSGFEPSTAEVTLQMGQGNSITLVLDDDVDGTGTLRLRLLDVETGAELSALPKVPYDLSF
jgi:RimJ/RimL family protein N-acetyltransferase